MAVSSEVMLVLATGHQRFREYLLASTHRCGVPLWVFDPEAPTWQRRYAAGWDVLDVFDPPTAVRAAQELSRRRTVRGVYCYHEAAILAAAEVAAALHLPGPTSDAVVAVRDKLRTRDRLSAAGLRQPRYAVVQPGEDPGPVAEKIGFPLVTKPRGLGASQGVVKVTGPEDLPTALEVARTTTQAGMANDGTVLLEEYLPGPEISLDAAVFDDEYLPYILARKLVGEEPYFEEVGHTIDPHDPLLQDRDLIDMVAAAHRAVGWHHGSTHTEVKLTPTGPVLVEINGRLGGDLIPYIGQLATGVDSGVVAADLALGRRPDITMSRAVHTAIRFLRPPVSAVVERVTLPQPGSVPGLVEAIPIAGPGDRLALPPEGFIPRYACLIAQGDSTQACEAALDRAAAATGLEYRPAEG
jgi:biotin carboxylase